MISNLHSIHVPCFYFRTETDKSRVVKRKTGDNSRFIRPCRNFVFGFLCCLKIHQQTLPQHTAASKEATNKKTTTTIMFGNGKSVVFWAFPLFPENIVVYTSNIKFIGLLKPELP